jgi:hypothetical protein
MGNTRWETDYTSKPSNDYGYPLPVRIVWETVPPTDTNHFYLLEPPVGDFIHLREWFPTQPEIKGDKVWVSSNHISMIVIDN